ncbi:hypothetical protein SERLADRAFT_464790 [Serpula lacrymans var. lacrymans S7.9]|uniref:Uncharacterized protein n=1 Tax=Serpula lacrymans var. lacrymans (strain S7.9) TaxID=578457 RepID=F8NTY1_SERL9|nr:uncharacterized protein SERLADRAFT_464790 [Serpula lacrymans var. lacrymans S7.9]EGO25108.1 hypothetical protein SERLADRAFT_464790 [Serpula lacrymans var. lacrymans S7.9]
MTSHCRQPFAQDSHLGRGTTHIQPECTYPAGALRHTFCSDEHNCVILANPSQDVGERTMLFPSGRNSHYERIYAYCHFIVVVAYARTSASDYDDWEAVHQNTGWGSTVLIPLLKKTET